MLRRLSHDLQRNTQNIDTPVYRACVLVERLLVTARKIEGINILCSGIARLKLHIKARRRCDLYLGGVKGAGLLRAMRRARIGLRCMTRITCRVALEPIAKCRRNHRTVGHRKNAHGNVKLLIAFPDSGRVLLARFPQIAPAQNLTRFAINLELGNLIGHIALSVQPSHRILFEPNLLGGSLDHIFKMQDARLVGTRG